MSTLSTQRFYDELRLALIAFFDLNSKESQAIVSDLLICLEEQTKTLAKHAEQPTSRNYLLAYDSIVTVTKKLQVNDLAGMLNRLGKCDMPAHVEERKRVINELHKRLSAARTLHQS
jgi:hypothetical protein